MASTFLSGFAIATDGTLWAWGSNSNGELARSPFSTSYSLVPVQIGASAAWDELAAGTLHVLGRQGTALYGWGSNGNSQLAQGSSVGFVATPTRILSTQSISRLGAGDYHSFAITASGALYAWGMNVNGQLGGPNSGVAIGYASPTLVQTALAPWAEVDGAANFTLAKTANGRYYTFGANNLGQLGVGSVDAGGGLSFNYQAAEPDLSGVNLAANAPVISGGGSELGVKSSIGPVSVTVTNSGGVALSESFTVSLYLSRDSILDLNDLQLVSRTESGPLAAQAVRTVQFDSVAVPAVSTGSWFLLSQVNPVSVVDSYAPDNGAALAVTVRGPDLTVDSLQTPATQIAAGGNLAASFRLANVGTGAVGTGETVTIEAFLSPSANFVSGTAILLASRTHTGGLASAGSVTIPASGTWSLPVPSAQAAGTYYLLVMANRNAAVAEDGATTNLVSRAITITSYDLAVTAPTLPSGVVATNLPIRTVLSTVTTVFQNEGTSAYAGSGAVELHLSSDQTWDAGDRLLASTAAPAVSGANGGTSTRIITWSNVALPDVAPGPYYLLARFNAAAGETDQNLTNNQASVAVTLKGPDLTLDQLQMPATQVASGASLAVSSVRLANVGTGAVASTETVTVEAFLSPTANYVSGTAILLGSRTHTGGLASAASVTIPASGTWNLTVPAGQAAGSYHLLLLVNRNAAVTEDGTATNLVSRAVTITTYDLTVTVPTLPSGVSADNLGIRSVLSAVSTVVQNIGTSAYSGSGTVELHLSTDQTWDAGDLLLASKAAPALSAASGSTNTQTVTWTNVTLPQVAAGSYHLLARFKPASGETDQNLANNLAALAVTIKGPDLTLDLLELPSTQVAAGSNLNLVSFRLANVGGGAVRATETVTIEAFLSPTANFVSGTAILLASRTLTGGLAEASETTIGAWNLPISSGQAAGAYYLLLFVNRSGAVAEAGVTTNVLSQAITVTSYDLGLTQPTLGAGISASSLGVNTVLSSVSTVFQNVGSSGYAGGGTIGLYLSTDPTWDSSDRILYVGGSPAIVAAPTLTGVNGGGSSRVITWSNVTLPDVTPSAPGAYQPEGLGGTPPASSDYYLVARFIPAAGDTDRNAANDQASLAVALNPPSFSIDSFTFPGSTSVESGGSFGNVTYRLRNSGSGAVAANREVQISVYISEDGNLNPVQDVLLDRYYYTGSTPLLPAGSIALPQTNRALVLPQGLPNGRYYLLFVVNENGNVPGVVATYTAQLVNVGSLDVSVDVPTLSSTGSLGVNTTISSITATVNNNGGFAVPAGMVVKLRLSTDEQIDAGDALLATKMINTSIAGRGELPVIFSNIQVPDLGAGDFWILAEILLPDGLQDLDFSNNVSALKVTLERPDLSIASVNGIDALDLDVGPSSLTSVTFEVTNDSVALVPAGANVPYRVYLSSDPVLTVGVDPELAVGVISAPLSPKDTIRVGPITLSPPASTLGGTYQVFFVVNTNPDGTAGPLKESDASNNTYQAELLIQKATAPGRGMDFPSLEMGSSVPWVTVPDSRSFNGFVYQSPTLTSAGQTSILRYSVLGPTTLNVPWLLITDSTATVRDSLSYRLDGGAWQTLSSAYVPSYQPRQISIPAPTAAGTPTMVEWRFTRGNSVTNGYARVDLDVPAFYVYSDGEGSWLTTQDAAGIGGDVTTNTSLAQGQQVSLETILTGPGIVKFWWRTAAEETDELRLFLNGDPYDLPTYDFDETPEPARISGATPWTQVAVLLRPGPQTLRWTYSQGSNNAGARAYIDGLQFQAPIPSALSPNRLTDPADDDEYQGIPEGTVDFVIVEEGTSTPDNASYLLDDADGTSRLPIQVTMRNQGYAYLSNPIWDATKLHVSLSSNSVFGDGNDVLLGDYAKLTSVIGEEMVTFSAEINLPFDLASGDYRVRVRYMGADGVPEFTLANNTFDLGSITIRRAPNLEVGWLGGPETDYPWRPEDSVLVGYVVQNTGLGAVLSTQRFHVSVRLVAFDPDLANPSYTLVKDYGETPFNVFLPERGGEYPNGASIPVNAFVDLPTMRDMLVALGSIPAGTPEDAQAVYASRGVLRRYSYAFQFFVDSRNAILESSETNIFTGSGATQAFSIVSLENEEGERIATVGDFVGDPAFGDRFVDANFLNGVTFADSPDFQLFIQGYALGLIFNGSSFGPEGSPQLAYDPYAHNGQPSVVFPSGLTQKYLSLTFAFNALAEDLEIDVQVTDSLVGPWENVLTLTPPYDQPSGPSSLTGYLGVKDSPYVLSLDGNFTAVQRVWRPLLVVRDLVPLASSPSRFMRLQIRPTITTPPVAPSIVRAAASGGANPSVSLNWSLPSAQAPSVTYLIERSLFADAGYSALGSVSRGELTFVDASVQTNTTYHYRIRAINVAGSTVYVNSNAVTVPAGD